VGRTQYDIPHMLTVFVVCQQRVCCIRGGGELRVAGNNNGIGYGYVKKRREEGTRI
jgi:hypothetical protein